MERIKLWRDDCGKSIFLMIVCAMMAFVSGGLVIEAATILVFSIEIGEIGLSLVCAGALFIAVPIFFISIIGFGSILFDKEGV